jgi:hypothetical protein
MSSTHHLTVRRCVETPTGSAEEPHAATTHPTREEAAAALDEWRQLFLAQGFTLREELLTVHAYDGDRRTFVAYLYA